MSKLPQVKTGKKINIFHATRHAKMSHFGSTIQYNMNKKAISFFWTVLAEHREI